jgi:hypothetical protein
MEKQIPIYFDSVIIDSPFQGISESNPNIGRLKVRVFTKYGNRNGSYITEAVANQLIESATQGTTPVVGFFDPATQSWASHSGPTLANGYGYVENFLGWEPFEDTDGVTREYAVFSVVLFTDYYEEAKKIFGQNQSMELDPFSIDGDWTMIEGQEYFVYTKAKMLGFCVIGEHEPCFSVSSFFSKNDDIYKSQYEKFSSLLFNLKAQVEEAEKNNEGGEQPMNEFENKDIVEQVENPQVQEELQDTFQQTQETVESEVTETSAAENFEEKPAESESEIQEQVSEESSEFEVLQTKFNELQESYNQLQSDYSTAQARIEELEQFQTSINTELEGLRSKNEELQTSLQTYENQALEVENNRKNELIEKYEKVMKEEEISDIKEKANDFSYDELESKLAIAFANKQMAGNEVKKVPLPDPEKTQFALFMEKYRIDKN